MSDSRYRQGVSRRNSDRSPGHLDDRYPDRPSAPRRDSDRAFNYASDHYRGSRPAPRGDRDFPPDSRRSVSDNHSRSDSQDTTSKMDSDRAASDLARLFRMWQETIVDQVRWTNKEEGVLEGFRKRLATYERSGGRNAAEPSVAEAWRKHQEHYNQEEEKIEKELAKINAVIKNTTDNIAYLLVKSLPVGEIKERQLIDAVKLELGHDHNLTPTDWAPKLENQLASLSEKHHTLATDALKTKERNEELLQTRISPIENRTQMLEKQMASFLESQKALQANFDKLEKENQELRSRTASYEAQAADLTVLKVQQEQMQLELSKKVSQDEKMETLKQENETLISETSALKTQLADIVKKVDLQYADLTRSLQEATAQSSTSTIPADSIPPLAFKAVEEKVEDLRKQVEKHEETLRDIDADEYARAITKLIQYPEYSELKRTLQDQQSELERRVGLETKGLSSNMANLKVDIAGTSKRLTDLKDKSEKGFLQFSNQIIEACAKLVLDNGKEVKDLETRVNALETGTAVVSRGLSAPSAVGATSPRPTNAALASGDNPAIELGEIKVINTAIQGLREDNSKIRNALSLLQKEVRDSYKVLEMMIIGLDEQFKNMSTSEMASIILDNVKRLLPNAVPLDMQNFHERLVDLETFRQEQTRRGLEHKAWLQSWSGDLHNIASAKRGLAEDDDGLEQPEKRQRVEGMIGT